MGRELVLHEVEEAVALGPRGVIGEVPGVERHEVVAAQVAPVRFRRRVGVAGELERGVRDDGGDSQGRPRQEGLDHRGRHIGAHQGEASVGADREVARVGLRLGEEARAGDGVVDLGLGVRPLVQYWVKVAVSWESSSVREGNTPAARRPRSSAFGQLCCRPTDPRSPGHWQSLDRLRSGCKNPTEP